MSKDRAGQQGILLMLLCVLALGVVQTRADSLTVEDLIGARKFLDEQSILKGVEQQLQNKQVTVFLQLQDFNRLGQAGFSKSFSEKLRSLLGKYGMAIADRSSPKTTVTAGSGKYHTLVITSQPPGAGTIVITPAPDDNGRLAAGIEVSVRPEAVAPYLFDHWQGDLRGYQPLKFRLSRDIRAVAVFKQPQKPTPPPKIEDPEGFKDTRKAGHVYVGEVVGVVEGQGFHKDWGIAAQVDYKYVYSLEYVSHVLSNDGYQIEEKRTFNSVKEMLFISKYQYRLDIRKDLEGVMRLLRVLGEMLYVIGDPTTKAWGKGIFVATKLADLTLGAIERKMVFGQKQIEGAFNSLEKVIGRSKALQNLKQRFLHSSMGKILGYPPHLKYLEGKTVVLRYENGVGLVDVGVESGILNTREKELMQRALYLSDYYIFRDRHDPKKTLAPGATWQVDARTLAGVIDPRLRHKAQGTIELRRMADEVDNKRRLAVFSLIEGRIRMVPTIDTQKIEGDIALTEGKIFYDLSQQYVVKAQLSGIAKYREISTDHLLFGARLATEPRITVHYQCSCTEQK